MLCLIKEERKQKQLSMQLEEFLGGKHSCTCLYEALPFPDEVSILFWVMSHHFGQASPMHYSWSFTEIN